MIVKKWINKAYPIFKTEQKIADVFKEKEEFSFSTVVIKDKDGYLAGIIKKKDLKKFDSQQKLGDVASDVTLYCFDNDLVEDAVLLLIESHDFVVPVVNENLKLKGVITVFEVLEALMEITSMAIESVRITFKLPDKPGFLKKIVDVLADEEINILSIITTPDEEGKKTVIIRTEKMNSEYIAEILEENDIVFESVSEEEGFSV
ncbi:MAG: ACT domain-containing protein [Kosmotoga sp.]|nr:MAG: ACT domain-containing protein [Kosmotoga sp.]